jgi:hypothetical protein
MGYRNSPSKARKTHDTPFSNAPATIPSVSMLATTAASRRHGGLAHQPAGRMTPAEPAPAPCIPSGLNPETAFDGSNAHQTGGRCRSYRRTSTPVVPVPLH